MIADSIERFCFDKFFSGNFFEFLEKLFQNLEGKNRKILKDGKIRTPWINLDDLEPCSDSPRKFFSWLFFLNLTGICKAFKILRKR